MGEDGPKKKQWDPLDLAVWEPGRGRPVTPLTPFERLIRNLKVDLKINEFWNKLANAKKTELLNIKKEKNKDKLQRQLEALVENKAVGELVAPLVMEDFEKAQSLLDNKNFQKYIQKRLKEKVKKAVDAEAEEQQKEKREAVEEKKRQERKNLRKANQTLTNINHRMNEILAGEVTGVADGAMVPVPIPARPRPKAPLFKTSHSSTRPPEKQPPPEKRPKRKRPAGPAKRPTGPAKAPKRKSSGAGGSGLSLKQKAKNQRVLPWAIKQGMVSPEKQPPSEQQGSSKERGKRPVSRS